VPDDGVGDDDGDDGDDGDDDLIGGAGGSADGVDFAPSVQPPWSCSSGSGGESALIVGAFAVALGRRRRRF
jgi:uncharacterized protein (TIGR03382 family)